MKKSLLLLFCCLSTVFCLFAKKMTFSSPDGGLPRIVLQADTNTVLIDSQLCIKVLAYGFQDADSLQLSMAPGRTFGEFDSLRQALTGTSTAQADATNPNLPISITWKNARPGDALPDGSVLFEFCVRGAMAGEAIAGVVNYPTLVKVFNHDGQSQELDYSEDWRFTYYVFPTEAIALAITDTVVAPGQPICLRLEVVNFEKKLVGMQFGIKWDSAMLKFDSIKAGNFATINNPLNFGFTQISGGKLRFAWTDNTLEGLQLEQGDRFFEMCFTILDTTGNTQVFFSQEVLRFEFFDVNLNLYNISATKGDVSITTDPMIRPGDTNRDGMVNHFDLLNIGLGYGAQGPVRQHASLNWEDQPTADWDQQLPLSQKNYKHFDTDGNGLIELLDAIAIDTNWDLTTEDGLVGDEQVQPREEGIPLYVKTKKIAPTGQPVTFDIILGEANKKATDLYGIAFSIEYDHKILAGNNNPVFATFDTTWLGKTGENLLVFQKNNPTEHRIDIALVRTDGKNQTGFGTIGQLHFTAPIFAGETPPGTDTVGSLPFRVENVRAIDFAELEQSTAPMQTTAIIDISTAIVNPTLAQKVRVFPNPVSETLFIQTNDLNIEQVEIFNVQGQLLQRYGNVAQLSVTALPAGVYSLRLITDKGVVSKRVVVK